MTGVEMSFKELYRKTKLATNLSVLTQCLFFSIHYSDFVLLHYLPSRRLYHFAVDFMSVHKKTFPCNEILRLLNGHKRKVFENKGNFYTFTIHFSHLLWSHTCRGEKTSFLTLKWSPEFFSVEADEVCQ